MQLHLNEEEILIALREFVARHTGIAMGQIGDINLVAGRAPNGHRAEIDLAGMTTPVTEPTSGAIGSKQAVAEMLEDAATLGTGSAVVTVQHIPAADVFAEAQAAETAVPPAPAGGDEQSSGPQPLPPEVTRKKAAPNTFGTGFTDEQRAAAEAALARVEASDPEEEEELPWDEPTGTVQEPEPAFEEPAPEVPAPAPASTVGDIFNAPAPKATPQITPKTDVKGLFD